MRFGEISSLGFNETTRIVALAPIRMQLTRLEISCISRRSGVVSKVLYKTRTGSFAVTPFIKVSADRWPALFSQPQSTIGGVSKMKGANDDALPYFGRYIGLQCFSLRRP